MLVGVLLGLGCKCRIASAELSAWAQEMLSPLVVATLESLAQAAEPGALVHELRALFPHLLQLVCSRQAPIRAALAALFRQHLPALLPL